MRSKVAETCEDTSKSCLINLEMAGVKEAIKLNEKLGFVSACKVKTINRASAVFQEIRYRFINYYIKKSGYKNILDVGCGYSPRTFEFLPEGYKYVGIELPDVVEAVTRAQKECLPQEEFKNVRYEFAKLIDVEGIEKAAEGLEGPVCIVVEGVFMYFTAEDLDKTLTAFRNILKRNGGCIITPDYMTNMMMKAAFISYAGPIIGTLMRKASYKILEHYTARTNDAYMDPVRQFASDSDQHAKDFFEERGFKVKRVPLYMPDMTMASFENMDAKTRKAMDRYSRLYGWIVECQ